MWPGSGFRKNPAQPVPKLPIRILNPTIHAPYLVRVSCLEYVFLLCYSFLYVSRSSGDCIIPSCILALQAGLQIAKYGRISKFPREFFSKLHGIFCILNHSPPSK